MESGVKAIAEMVPTESAFVDEILREVDRVIVGQHTSGSRAPILSTGTREARERPGGLMAINLGETGHSAGASACGPGGGRPFGPMQLEPNAPHEIAPCAPGSSPDGSADAGSLAPERNAACMARSRRFGNDRSRTRFGRRLRKCGTCGTAQDVERYPIRADIRRPSAALTARRGPDRSEGYRTFSVAVPMGLR